MRFFKKLSSVAVLALALVTVSGCAENFFDINNDPTQPTSVGPQLLLPSAEVQIGYVIGYQDMRFGSTYIQYYSGHRGQPEQFSLYAANSSLTGPFGYFYSAASGASSGPIKNLTVLIEAERTRNPHFTGIARVLRAYCYHVLVDHFGDVPYTEAVGPISNPNVLAPKYDNDATIYPALQAELSLAITELSTPASANQLLPVNNGDLIYNGNTAAWIRFANGLKLRMFNTLSKIDATAALNFLNTAPALMTSNVQDAAVPFFDAAQNRNPVYGIERLDRDDNAVASTIINAFNGGTPAVTSDDDPRTGAYFLPNSSATSYIGRPVGGPVGSDEDLGGLKYARTGDLFGAANAGVDLFSYREQQFIIAEIRLRAGDTPAAQTALSSAVTASFDHAAATIPGTYIANNATLTGTPTQQLQTLITEKWKAMFPYGYIAWTDWRRTGFPTLTAAANNVLNLTGNTLPRRLPYPQGELLNNAANVPSEGAQPSLGRVFWDN